MSLTERFSTYPGPGWDDEGPQPQITRESQTMRKYEQAGIAVDQVLLPKDGVDWA